MLEHREARLCGPTVLVVRSGGLEELLDVFDRFLSTTQGDEDVRGNQVRFWDLVARALQLGQGLIRVAIIRKNAGRQNVSDTTGIGNNLEGTPRHCARIVKAPQFCQRDTEIGKRCGMFGRDIDRLLKILRGILQIAKSSLGNAEFVQAVGIFRVDRHRLLKCGNGIGVFLVGGGAHSAVERFLGLRRNLMLKLVQGYRIVPGLGHVGCFR